MHLSATQLAYLVDGAALLGSGGGGAIATGQAFVRLILDATNGQGLPLLTEPTNPQAGACVVCDIGAITAIEANQQQAILNAFDALVVATSAARHPAPTVVMPIETGPENSLVPLVLAATRGLAVLDADGAGRAVPSLPLCTLTALPACPALIANQEGDYLRVQTATVASLDALLRPITASDQFGNSASLALWGASAGELWANAVPGAISQAVWCGQLLAGLRSRQPVLVAEALPHVNRRQGMILGSGRVLTVRQRQTGAFDVGTIQIADQLAGRVLTILTQNENLIVFSSTDTAPLLAAPHSICYLKTDLSPLTNSEIEVGQEVYLLGIAADERLLTPALLTGFSALLGQLGYGGRLPDLPDSSTQLGSLLTGLF